jgi:hypothetical protein
MHNFPFMRSSGPCVQKSLHNNVAVLDGSGRECSSPGRDIRIEKEWQCTMDDSGVILLIHAHINAKIANKWVIHSHSDSEFGPNI